MAKTKSKKENEEVVLDKIVEETTKETKTIEVPAKIDTQELASVQSMIKTIDQLTNEIGQVEVRKHAIMKAMEQVQTRIEAQRVKLQDKYGTDNINIQDGTINYPNENPTPNTQENVETDKKD